MNPAYAQNSGFAFDGLPNMFLMAEDNPVDEELVREMLRQAFGERYRMVCVNRFEKIPEALSNGKFEALILDMGLPDQSGTNAVSELGERYPDLPIVVLTGQDRLDLAVTTLQKGAQDYLTKNHITPEILFRSLYYARERKQIERKLRQALEDSAYRNMQLEAQAKHDALTELPNRAYLYEIGNRVLYRAKRHSQIVALLFFDLNGFKKVNDSYGHIVGDKLLKKVAEQLLQKVRDTDLLVRLGGDEFVVLTDVLHDREEVYPLINRLLQAFVAPFRIENHQIAIRPAIGVAFYPEAENLDLLLKNADAAMYEAKSEETENPVCFFTESIADQFARAHRIEQHLGNALANNEFSVVFQPIHYSNQEKYSVEALIRWYSPELQEVSPDTFISIAENTPIVNDITRLVVSKAGQLDQQLVKQKCPVGIVTINVCASQLEFPHFCDLFLHWLQEFQLPTNRVCLELTERQIVRKTRACREQLQHLRKEGITIALDDYGTGYSSLSHLLNLDIDILKLDRSIVDSFDSNTCHRALAAGIVEMSHQMGMKVVAEGVERKEEFDVAKELNFDAIQGYFVAKPMELQDTVDFLVSKQLAG